MSWPTRTSRIWVPICAVDEPIMAAALLTRGRSVIENVPALRDVYAMIEMLDVLGAKTEFADGTLTIDTTNATGVDAPYDLVRKMRASIYVMAPLLAFHGKARVSMPGGCAWGPRPIDLHLMAMEKLGAQTRGEAVANAFRQGLIE